MAPMFKDETYTAVLHWLAETQIEYVPEGKRQGTESYLRYAKYSTAKTVGEALALGSKPADLCNDYEKKILKVVGGPQRSAPLDVDAVADKSTLTDTDRALGCFKSKAKTLRTKDIAKQLGLDDQEFESQVLEKRAGSSWCETPMMRAKRLVAEKAAEGILEEVGKAGGKITDEHVLGILRQWAFRRNQVRKNVQPKNVSWVDSDTFGVMRNQAGVWVVTQVSRDYPATTRLLARWLRDNRPEELGEADFPFTSIHVNFRFAARRHRDHLNVGPVVVKALGDFSSGGRLLYWADDNGTSEMEKLPESGKVALDVRASAKLLDGNRAHEVEAFEGERFSLVYFTHERYWKMPADVQSSLAKVDITPPHEEEIDNLRRRFAAPKGYPTVGVKASAVSELFSGKHPREGAEQDRPPAECQAPAAAPAGGGGAEGQARRTVASPPQTPRRTAGSEDGAPPGGLSGAKPTRPGQGLLKVFGAKRLGNAVGQAEKPEPPSKRPRAAAAGGDAPRRLGDAAAPQGFQHLALALEEADADEGGMDVMAEYFQSLLQSEEGAQDFGCALELLTSSGFGVPTVPEDVVKMAIGKAFNKTVSSGACLPEIALEARRTCDTRGGRALTLEVVASARSKVLQVRAPAAANVTPLVNVLQASSTNHRETFHLVRLLRGEGPECAMVLRALGQALVLTGPGAGAWPSDEGKRCAVEGMGRALVFAFGETGGAADRLAEAVLGNPRAAALCKQCRPQCKVPLLPMSAVLYGDSEGDVDVVLNRSAGSAVILEQRLAGVRVQVHKKGASISIFDTQQRDMTASCDGQLLAAVRVAASCDECVLDAVLQGKKTRLALFDCMWLNGRSLTRRPLSERRRALERLVTPSARISCAVAQEFTLVNPPDQDAVYNFLRAALASGSSGVVLKRQESTYEAGRVSRAWLGVAPQEAR